jgi:hypothetical protein
MKNGSHKASIPAICRWRSVNGGADFASGQSRFAGRLGRWRPAT